jgi:uncharacterized protein YukE
MSITSGSYRRQAQSIIGVGDALRLAGREYCNAIQSTEWTGNSGDKFKQLGYSLMQALDSHVNQLNQVSEQMNSVANVLDLKECSID